MPQIFIRRPWYSCKSTCCERSSCFRTAIAAGVGAGIYASMEETAEEFVQWEQTFEPVTENHELYKEFYETWKTVYDSQLALADKGLTSHMWIAPGAL